MQVPFAILTLPYTEDSYTVECFSQYPEDRLEYAMCEARLHMFERDAGAQSIDEGTRKALGARADLLNIWGDLIVRTDGAGLSMDILL